MVNDWPPERKVFRQPKIEVLTVREICVDYVAYCYVFLEPKL